MITNNKQRPPLVKKAQGGISLPAFSNSIGNITGLPDYAANFSNMANGVMSSIKSKTNLATSLGNNLPQILQAPDLKSTIKKSGFGIGNKLTGLNSKLGKPLGKGMPSIGGVATSALSVADKFIPQAEDKASKITSGVFNGLSNIAGMIPGVGTVASVALKGLGTLFGAGVKKVKGNTADELVDTSASYTGEDALASKRFGIAGLGKAKEYKNQVQQRQLERDTAHDVIQTGKDDLLASTNVQQLQLADNLNKNGNGWMYSTHIGRNGMKIQEAKRLSSLYANKVNSFKNGGTVNVIPEGALHARKNNLTEVDPELDGNITKKGIPVITKAENGEITQHAEIERSEIIFNLEVTKKLEELSKAGTDEAAIEAGKLLAEQIMTNTIDNTGELLND